MWPSVAVSFGILTWMYLARLHFRVRCEPRVYPRHCTRFVEVYRYDTASGRSRTGCESTVEEIRITKHVTITLVTHPDCSVGTGVIYRG